MVYICVEILIWSKCFKLIIGHCLKTEEKEKPNANLGFAVCTEPSFFQFS